MKYKIGDKVRVISCEDNNILPGKTGHVIVVREKSEWPYLVFIIGFGQLAFLESELEKA